jgi:hypothetical protein
LTPICHPPASPLELALKRKIDHIIMNQFDTQNAGAVAGLLGNPIYGQECTAESQSAVDSAMDRLANAIRRATDAQQFLESRTSPVTIPWGCAPKAQSDTKEPVKRERCRLEEALTTATNLIHDLADRQEALGKAIQL